MTGQATFGDLLDAAARRHLAVAARPGHPPPGGEDLLTASQSTRRLLQVLRRYAQDIATGFGTTPGRNPDPEDPWEQALSDLQRDLTRAAACLAMPVTPRANPGARPAVSAASEIDQGAAQLQAGRELLDTHFQSRPDGSRSHHTEWAPALEALPVRRALLAEVISLAQLTAVTSRRLAQAPGWRGAPGPRHALAETSQRLHALCESARASQQHEPVSATHHDLLRAIPASMLPPRRLPEPRAAIPALCHGAITSAARLRRAAWQTASQPSSSSATIASLRQIAAASTVTSHHCELLLRAAAERAAVHFPAPKTSQDILKAADQAAATRASWLTLSRTLDHFTTQAHDRLSTAAVEAPNLATWTGRLAYADATWTLASGPAGQLRPADTLAPHLADIPRIIATVHHAATTLGAAADAEHDQAQQAAKAGHLLVPTRALARPATQPLTPAPRSWVRDLLRAYRAAGQASADTVTHLAGIAASVDAPSRILTTASTAAGIDHDQRWRRVPDPSPSAARPGLAPWKPASAISAPPAPGSSSERSPSTAPAPSSSSTPPETPERGTAAQLQPSSASPPPPPRSSTTSSTPATSAPTHRIGLGRRSMTALSRSRDAESA
jgi:hypothetical protein